MKSTSHAPSRRQSWARAVKLPNRLLVAIAAWAPSACNPGLRGRWRKTLPLLGCLAVALLGLAVGADAQEYRVLYTFSAVDSNGFNSDGAASVAPLLLGMDGNFYGTTSAGGANGTGTIFQLTPAGVLTTLYTFSALNNGGNSDGATPVAGLIQDGNGNFYGTAQYGGPSGCGTVFEWTAAGQFSLITAFSGDNGQYPDSALIFGNDGNLYGTTSQGGDGKGTIFTIPFNNQVPTFVNSLYSLNGTSDGSAPVAALLLASDGNFYGTAENDGANGYGTVFEFTYDGHFRVLYNFTGPGNDNCAHPTAPLIQGNDGNFYGTTTQGGGNSAQDTVFSITPAGKEATLFEDGQSGGGSGASGGLIQGSDGNFYGATPAFSYELPISPGGIIYLGGSVYRVMPGGGSTVLYNFTSQPNESEGGDSGDTSDGGFCRAALIEGNDGTFYGTASMGGANGSGTIFQLDVPPFLTSSATATAQVGQPFSYRITAADSPESYSVTGLSEGLTFNYRTGAISGTPTATGTLNLTVSASNDAGTTSQSLTITVNVAPPVITSAKTASGTVGAAFSYQITASNSPTSFAASSLPPGLSVNTSTGLISGTPTTASTYQVSVGASNAGGTASSTVTITIKVPAPVITSATTATATQGVAFSYQITASNSPASFGVQGLPSGVSVNTKTGLISGTVSGAGKVSLTLNAYNAAGKGAATLMLTIKAAPPVITSATTASATVGKAFSYRITASNQPTSFGVQGLPAGFSVNTSTGLLTGTPKAAGKVNLTLNAYNAAGKGSAPLTLTIAAN